MPAPLAVDREAVRVLVVAVGVREAARQMDLSEDTVLSWARRGGWLQAASAAKDRAMQSLATRQPNAVQSHALKAADALAATLAENGKRTKLGLTAYAARMAERARDEGIIEEAPLYKAVADIHGKMFPEQASEDRVTLQFFHITQEQEPPTYDLPE